MTACDVLVVGGSGRVGGSTLRWLDRLWRRSHGDLQPLKLAIGGRRPDHFEEAKRRLALRDLAFVPLDLDGGSEALITAVRTARLVVHTAGPFQGRSEPELLHACITAGVPYCDVSDELLLSRNGKSLSAEAAAAGIPAVVSSGIWPGVSALMAAVAVERLGGSQACDRVDLSFFTAGSGGAGPTIVSATFLLLAIEVLTVVDGQLSPKQPWTERRMVDFGAGIGERACYLLDNPDVPTTAEALGVANCASRFGTSPGVWNSLFGAIKALPSDLLRNRAAMQGVAQVSMPIIRAVDALVGTTNAIRVDAYRKGHDGAGLDARLTLRCVHPDLEDCVGQATAAFAMELLRGRMASAPGLPTIAPGVWFPAELPASARSNILQVAREKTLIWQM